jgi:lysozyme family protein
VGHKNVREALKGAYRGKKWAAKVDAMTDAQAVAVYFRLQREGKVK